MSKIARSIADELSRGNEEDAASATEIIDHNLAPTLALVERLATGLKASRNVSTQWSIKKADALLTDYKAWKEVKG